MKYLLPLFLVLAACAQQPATPTPAPAPEGFAIYRLAEEGPASLLEGRALDELALAETPIADPGDLITYDTATHTMSLSAEAYERVRDLFAAPVPTGGIPFVVTAGRERIYAGAFWTPLSSLSYDGVVILDPLALSPPRLQLTLGYPGAEAFTGEDPRSDPRILAAVEAR